jgi:hypothetical protein
MQNFEITVVKEIHVSKLEIQRWSLEFVLFFSKLYIWDLEKSYVLIIRAHLPIK